MAWYPKAIRKPITRHDTPMARYRGICNHVAVSEGMSLFSYFNIPGNATSHFYVRKTGKVEQYVDTRFQAPANLQGNPSLISIETQGGVHSAETEPWTPEQVQALAELHAWIHETHPSIPLVLMKDSKPSTYGVGYHKLGVDPYRVDDGELWSKSAGKICPGKEKISQIPTIIAKAKALAGITDTEDELSAAEVADLKNFIEFTVQRYSAFNAKNLTQQLTTTLAAIDEMEDTDEIKAYVAAVSVQVQKHMDQTDDEATILAALAELKGQVAAVQADVDKLEAAEAADHPKG